MTWASKARAFFRKFDLKFWILFFLIFGLVQAGERQLENRTESTNSGNTVLDSLPVSTGFYQELLTWHRTPKVRDVFIVEINPEKDTADLSHRNVCEKRRILSKLLLQIARAQPKLIVVDIYFERRSCGYDANTLLLMDTIEQIRSGITELNIRGYSTPILGHSIPVVVALKSIPVDPEQGSPDDPKLLLPTLSFSGIGDAAQQGIVHTVRDDHRRLPLQFEVFPNQESIKSEETALYDSLALVTAKIANPHLFEENSTLASIANKDNQPFIGFLKPEQFKPYHHLYLSQVLCNTERPQANWRDCLEKPPWPPANLKGRVVLIGEAHRDVDMHDTVVGPLHGLYLQANYIEALLDDRFYLPVWLGWDAMFSLLFYMAIQLVAKMFENTPILSMMLMGGVTGFFFLVLFLIFLIFHVYLNVMVGLGFLGFKVLEAVYGYVRHSSD
jgi:CHASE2 domain-containing sensor protein